MSDAKHSATGEEPETRDGEASGDAPHEPEPREPEPSEPEPSETGGADSPEARELREAEVAFEVGDYRRCRALATKLAGSTRPAVADAARDLLRRTDVDPVQIVFLTLCACALIGVAYYYLGT
jgi:hypothetical protein